MSNPTDEALAGMSKTGRAPMGKEGVKFSSPSASPAAGTLVPKKNAAAGDPTGAGTKVNRTNQPYTGERKGAAYSIKASYMKATDPAAGLTQANGRIVSPAVVRSADSFAEGNGTSY
jgi:hypothetical protein